MNRFKKIGLFETGFTLIELIISLSIFAVVMVMVTAGLKSILDMHDKMQTRQERIRQLQFAMLILERDFEQMIQYGEKKSSLIYRGPGSIEFIRTGVINPMARNNKSTLQRIHYTLLGNTLVRISIFNWLLNENKKEDQHTTAILSEVEEFRVQFWTHQNTWVHQWPNIMKSSNGQNLITKTPQNFLPKALVFILKIKGMGIISKVFSIPIGDYDVTL